MYIYEKNDKRNDKDIYIYIYIYEKNYKRNDKDIYIYIYIYIFIFLTYLYFSSYIYL